MTIHPSAIVDPGARVDPAAEIGPFCVVGPDAAIGPGTRLIHSVTVTGRTTVGARNVLHPFCVVGGDPQDLKFRGEDSITIIGDDNVLREGVTVNKGTRGGGNRTVIGSHNFIMAFAHVAHDSELGDRCVLANGSLLGGHVRIDSDAIVSAMVAIHHFVTIGPHAFVGGYTRVTIDCPPFMIMQGLSSEIRGVNSVGLRRRGFTAAVINALRDAHRLVWRSGLPKPEALVELERRNGQIPEIRTLIEFLHASDRGRMGRARESFRTTPAAPEPEEEFTQ